MEELKQAVEVVKDILRCTQDMGYEEERSSMQTLIDLAERVIEIGGKMPEKKFFGENFDQKSNCDSNYVLGYNEAIDACTLAFAGMKGGEK